MPARGKTVVVRVGRPLGRYCPVEGCRRDRRAPVIPSDAAPIMAAGRAKTVTVWSVKTIRDDRQRRDRRAPVIPSDAAPVMAAGRAKTVAVWSVKT